MAQEFVDLYEVLDLPVDADRGAVRKRINERYLDAQRNLDHRDFATRVKHQELFEVTLPQARYILLDDGRRDEYNRMVIASRSPDGMTTAAPPVPAPEAESTAAIPQSNPLSESGFSLQTPVGNAPVIAPLPQTPLDLAQQAQEREDLWKKWKSGLEAALTVEGNDKPKSRGAVTAAPTSFSVATTPESAPTPAQPAPAQPAPAQPAPVAPQIVAAPTPPTPAAKTPPPKVKISLDFDGANNTPAPASAPAPSAEESVVDHQHQHSDAEIEARRAENRRQITKEILVNIGLIWGIAGAALVIVPGVAALVAAIAHYYPRAATPLLGYPSVRLWIGGFLVIGVAAFFASRELSKSMRRKKAMALSSLSYEELLKQTGKT